MAMLGLREFEAALRRVEAGANRAARTAVAVVAAKVEKEAKANFEGSHKRGEPHVGGDKPNVVTGDLRRSIRTDPIRRYSLADFGTVVAPRMKYGRRIELGYAGDGSGPGHQSTRAYPFFVEPAKKGQEEFRTVAAEQWSRFLIRG